MKQSNASAGRRLACFAVPAAMLWVGAQGAWAADTGCKMNTNYKEKVIDMVIGTILVPNDAAVGQ